MNENPDQKTVLQQYLATVVSVWPILIALLVYMTKF